jgi:hypothetical protein
MNMLMLCGLKVMAIVTSCADLLVRKSNKISPPSPSPKAHGHGFGESLVFA